jgi:mobilome CxxCx(11)CxxC protein
MAFGADSALFPGLLYLAGLLAIIQLAISVWSVVARWDERYEQAIESSRANTRLYNQWRKLVDHPAIQLSEKVEEALSLDYDQEQKDLALGITDKEKRFAMHESLFYFRKPCPACRNVPERKKPSECDMCGNY